MSSGERKRRRPNLYVAIHKGVRTDIREGTWSRNTWEGIPKKVRVLYTTEYPAVCIRSTHGHVESVGKIGGPPSKPKYYPMTDSGAVLWRKGEKNPGRGVKENLKPYVYKHTKCVNARCGTFCRTVRRVIVCSEVKVLSTGAAGKPSVNSTK